MRVPASFVAVPLVAGSAAGLLLAGSADPYLPLSAAAAAALTLIAALARLPDATAPDVVILAALGSVFAGVSLGASGAGAAYTSPLVAWFDACGGRAREEPVQIEGLLREDAALTPSGASITVDVKRIVQSACGDAGPGASGFRLQAQANPSGSEDGPAVPGGVRLSVGGSAAPTYLPEWRAGRTIRVTALLRRPTAYRNPGVPDDARALARRGVALVGSIKSAALVEVVRPGGAAAEAASAARSWTRAELAQHVGRWSSRSSAVSAAILLGDRSGLSNDDERRLQEAGTYHVIAISGGNIAILTGLLLGGLRAVRVPPRSTYASTIVALIFYAELTGLPASVGRAVAVASIYLVARLLDHRGSTINALAVAAVGALALWPVAVFDAGFLLSFGATLGILIGLPTLPGRRSPAAEPRPRPCARVLTAARALLAATICAEAAIAPLGAALFSRITFAGLLLNFVAIPLMTVAELGSMTTLVLAPVAPVAASACGLVVHLSAAGLVESARLIDAAPWLVRDVPPPSWWLCAGYYACLIVAVVSRRLRGAALTGLALASTVMIAGPVRASRDGVPHRSGTLRVVFLDVGQGDATLVTLPDGRALLVDAGGLPGSAFDMGERVVSPALRALGVRRLETLVLTHGDPDHIGGAPAVLRRFAPRSVWEGVPVPPHPGLRAISTAVSARAAVWRVVQAGDFERDGGVELHVRHPPPPEWERQRVRNDDSVVLELRFGRVSILLPGDIGREGEQAVFPRLSLPPMVILKAPHHGSATSSTPAFLAAINPDAVIVSAGRGNHFGHPAPSVVDRYRQSGAAMFRTDQDGAVILETDGESVEIRAWSGRRTVFAALRHENHETTKVTK